MKGHNEMTSKMQSAVLSQGATLKAYVDKIGAQVHEGKARLDLLQATAQKNKAQAHIEAIGGLKTAKDNIEKKLQDLSTTHDAHVARAKADIDEQVARFKATLDALATKIESHSTTK
jgi:hypothetical protein